MTTISCEWRNGGECALASRIVSGISDAGLPVLTTDNACEACQSKCPAPTVDLPGTVVAGLALFAASRQTITVPPAVRERLKSQLTTVAPPTGSSGPGTEITKITASIKLKPVKGCTCAEMARRMDELGPDGCRREIDKLAAGVWANFRLYSSAQIIVAASRLLWSGLAWSINPLQPFHSLIELACVKAEEAAKANRDPSRLRVTFDGEPTRHMLYHIWPTRSSDAWRWNVEQLLRRIDLFDGVRSVAVVTDESTDTLADVQSAFDGHRIDNWIHLPNNPAIREGVTFVPLMNTLPRGPNDVTWYGHAKGVRHQTEGTTRQWAEAMYQLTLDEWPRVRASLEQWPITGSFKRYGEFKLPNHEPWHYSGTYFWFRNADVFARDGWNDLAPAFFACVEAWPARIFAADEAGCLFGNNAGNLYEGKEWERWTPLLNVRRSTSGS